MIYRCIAPNWLIEQNPGFSRVKEGEFTSEQIAELNAVGYNIYYLPNSPSIYHPGTNVTGADIDQFNFVFVDMDLKDCIYNSKEEFINAVKAANVNPSFIVDSGGGIHAYWLVSDLDALSYLKLSRRLMRRFKTDEAVGQIFQLMRAPDTFNTKIESEFRKCETLYATSNQYTCEELDNILPPLSQTDEQYCLNHYNKTYKINQKDIKVDEKIPLKFAKLLESNEEVKNIWTGGVEDRSIGDYRLGHLMFASGFTKEEATSVLVNSAKALERAPIHRISYATNIVDKIWTFEITSSTGNLSMSVADILKQSGDKIKGTRFRCWDYLDNTAHGFRLGQVLGLIAGSGVGKTAIALNMFMGFVECNPSYTHFFIPLEQPANEIAERWRDLCGDNTSLHDKVQVLSNYDTDGNFRHLSLDEIKDYLIKFKDETGRPIGCVVIDHIGALKKKNSKTGENQDLIAICHAMKAFAVQTNTLVVMQSQAPREKAGIGDIELDKDAAYGTMYFEAYCDYVITMWQPLKRCYDQPDCPTVTAFKFCKIRHKKQGVDKIKEDVRYILMFDPKTGRLEQLNQDQEKQFDFFNKQAAKKREANKKTDVLTYTSVKWEISA